MLKTRVIPCLLLSDQSLVKTVKFREPRYIGDPLNAVRIFNDKEADELIFLDISATPGNREPDFELIRQLANECFMPFAYGGGIRTMEHAERLFALGVEKLVINSFAAEHPEFIRELSSRYGSQSIVASVDVKRNLFGKPVVYTHGGKTKAGSDLAAHVKKLEDAGAGEIVVNSIDRDGTLSGYDIPLMKDIVNAVRVPVVALGGAGSFTHLTDVIKEAGVSAVAAGSLFVLHGDHRAVLITYPGIAEMKKYIDI